MRVVPVDFTGKVYTQNEVELLYACKLGKLLKTRYTQIRVEMPYACSVSCLHRKSLHAKRG